MTPPPIPSEVPGYPVNGIYTIALLAFCVLVVYYVRRLKQ